MSAPYRSAGSPASGPVRIVRFPRPVNVASIAKMGAAMILGVILTFLWGWAEMECSRATGTCEVREWHSLVRRVHTIPLADIRGVRVTEHKANKGGLYRVVWLDTPAGPEEVTRSSLSADPADASAFATKLSAFLATPSQPTFRASMTAQLSNMIVAGVTSLLLLLGLLAIVADIVIARRGTTVGIDEGRRVVLLPPLRDQPAREVPLGDVVAVEIDKVEAPAKADPYYAPPVFLVLVTRSGERIPATPAAPRDHDAFDTDASRARLAEALGVSPPPAPIRG